MDIQIYVCDDAAGLIRTRTEIDGLATILYETPDATGEAGNLVRFLVSTKRSSGATLSDLSGKFVIVATM